MASPQHAVNLMAGQINAAMQRAIRDQRNYTETLAEQTVRDGNVHGFLELASSGEHLVDVTFPLYFVERPLFTSGLELGGNAWLTYGSFPVWSATVGGWRTEKVGDSTLYSGARLGVVVFQNPSTVLHYSFQGRTLTVPTGTEHAVSAPL